MVLVSIFLSTRKQGCACTQTTDVKPRKESRLYVKLRLPVIVLVGRAQADSSVMADSWRYTPESVDPGRKAGTPHLGSLDCLEGLTD